MTSSEATSTRPYLVRALHEWCTDNGFTPYVAVRVDESVQVPREYVKDGEIVLNVSFDATSALQLGNDFIEFKARFGGKSRDILVPIERVIAIYARENGQGMAFPPPEDLPVGAVDHASAPVELTAEPDVADSPVVGLAVDFSTPVPDERLVQLVPMDEGRRNPEGGDIPRPPSAGAGSRPALKRVK